jgi:moderate conductance mechanosensitive channel
MAMNLLARLSADQVAIWIQQHALQVGLIVVLTLVAWIGVGWFTAWLQRRFLPEDTDESGHKLARSLAKVTCWVINVAIVLVAAAFLLRVLGVRTDPILARVRDWTMTNGLQLVLTLFVAYVALRFSGFVSTRLLSLLQRDKTDLEAAKRAGTLSAVVNWAMRTGILIVAIMMSLSALGLDVAPMIAAAGIVGLAIGFGAQNLVQDVISGFFILLEDQVRVGDVVQLNDKGGLVERITLRTIILRDLAGSVHYVRNGKIDIVTNMTKDYSRYVFDVGVAYRENVDEVIEVLKQIDAGLREDPEFKDDILQPIEILGLDKFADSALIIKARTTTKPIKQWRVGREFNRRLKMKFDELGIEIPFPHLTLYPGQDKKGDSPPLCLKVDAATTRLLTNQPDPAGREDPHSKPTSPGTDPLESRPEKNSAGKA